MKKLLLYLFLLPLCLACSKDKERYRKLTLAELVGTVWSVEEVAIAGEVSIGFRENVDNVYTFIFESGSEILSDRKGAYIRTTIYYELTNELMIFNSYRGERMLGTYQIRNYTGDSFEMVLTTEFHNPIVELSGYDYARKFVLRKIKDR